ncbi:N-acetylneuraminate epimerase [Pirellulimonas nuda]|uniref:N-acetylneuraminate epimerase n=1 Tax=Pirellulimonas nuda TaxID=2528009 RepID=A0A518DEG1_9BACT|nr:family 16 glycoside hydrolase [Pirellulimonas nuda]QDU89860.1 N-acetylneuraminate epimerase [Pirellulimonas nuda]
MRLRILLLLATTCVSAPLALGEDAPWRELLDPELSQWELYMGIPHVSTPIEWQGKSENCRTGKPLGLGNDPLKVFTTRQIDGETVLHISGQVYGGLTSLEEFEDYQLSVETRWLDKKWPPRADTLKDSGVLYHCVGDHGAFWKVWMRCLECQVQQGDFGDFYPLAGTAADVKLNPSGKNRNRFNPEGKSTVVGARNGPGIGSARRGPNAERPDGEWNRVEVYTVGDKAIHVVNGVPVMLLENTRQKKGDGFEPLTKGKIQIQSEAAEIEYRRIRVRPIRRFPAELAAAVGLEAPAAQPAGSAPVKDQAAESAWQTLDPRGVPDKRHECGFVECGGKFYLLGGRRQQSIGIYDPVVNAWTEGAIPPVEVHHFQAAAVDGEVWIAGGMTGPYPNEKPLANVLIYDPKQDRWRQGPEIPADRRRGAAGAVLHDGGLYLVGGIVDGHNGGFIPWFDRYDLKTGKWTRLPDAPHARDHFHAAVAGGALWAAGGRTTSKDTGKVFELTIDDVDRYDFETGKWSTPTRIPTPRGGSFATSVGDLLIVAGGESGRPLAHDEVEAFDTQTGQWRSLPRFARGRHGTGILSFDGRLFVAAGSGRRGGNPELDSIEALRLP